MARAAVIDNTPLGSLTQPSSRTSRRCDGCGSDRVTELAMTLTDGHKVACHHPLARG